MNTTSALDTDAIVKHWTDTSDEDFETMAALLQAKRYSWALFVGHLVIEKLLKAYYVRRRGCHAPLTHNLYRIAHSGGLALTNEQAEWLIIITEFQISTRYDDYKRRFYLRCTAEYTAEWAANIKQLRLWIKSQL